MPVSHLFFLLFFSHLSLCFSLNCNAADRKALLNIKSELGNPPELSTWLPATNCCTWSNVYCTDSGRAIPDFLSRTNLSALDLSNNKFSGPIPLSLTKLSNLRYLDLRGNSLSGTIPPGLLHGTFRFMYLARNKLSGEIPEDYGNGDMDMIDLSHNRLTGNPSFLFNITIPTTKIDLSWNLLEFDLTRVVLPHNLDYLDLSHNKIKGKVPKSLQDVKLSFLNLSYNELCGEIPNRRFMVRHQAESYLHNKCLCGTPLPPCKS
ncbi:hypothetical protein LUZ61_003774 [Rhynchospora tenuis]|uniref:Leucine-rich repeat-containing N-terminal plant-type domain-containing protein n=1 Tax=Rhynchospora tenuis TaxID=198213 RepID=A0AAD5ZLH6_9POAL|nr:hypothetical protein LUZ61_003774 [Rhynchospora tenuis]